MHLGRHLADRALDLGMAGMADQHDLAALGGVAPALVVHLGDQRAGGVDHRQVPLGGQLLDPLGDAMGGEDRHRAGRDLVQLVDEHRAAGAAGPRPRGGCGRSRAGHRSAGRISSRPARRSRSPAPRRRRSRGAGPGRRGSCGNSPNGGAVPQVRPDMAVGYGMPHREVRAMAVRAYGTKPVGCGNAVNSADRRLDWATHACDSAQPRSARCDPIVG